MGDRKTLPLVSIIIPVYNGSDYMREAIDSALAQTYENLEIIVVNDGSTDDGATERIALSYGDKIRYIPKPNGGVSSALNTGIRNMRGEYFSWLSHDDTYAPEKVAAQVEVLRQAADPRAVALCDYRQIDSNSNPLSDARRSVLFRRSCTLNWQEALISLFKQGCYNGCAFLIPRAVFDECGGFHEGLRYSQDILMWIQIFLHKYSLVYSDRPDISNRIHDKQMTQTAKSLYHSDSAVVGQQVIPQLRDGSDKKYPLLYHYAKSSAIYQNTDVVRACVAAAKEKKLFTPGQKMALRFYMVYGNVRPMIRKLYYSLFKKVRTQ